MAGVGPTGEHWTWSLLAPLVPPGLGALALAGWTARESPATALGAALVALLLAFSAVLVARRITARLDAIQAKAARVTAAVQALPDGIAIFDRDDRLVFHNAQYPEHLVANLRRRLQIGRRFSEMLGDALVEGPVYHTDMGPDFASRRLAMRQRQAGRQEHCHRIADGRWLRIRESPTPDGDRILLTTDISEERRRAEELRLLATAVEQVGDPIEITDREEAFTFVNHAFEATTGWTSADALGRRPQDLLSSGAHPPEFFDTMREVLLDGATRQGTIVNRHRDGRLIEQETTISPIRDDTGAITHHIAVKRDVTEARAQARRLEESEARLRAVVETQTEFVLRIDTEGHWTFMNEATERYIGMSLSEVREAGLRDRDFIHKDDWPLFDAHLARLTPENPTHSIEFRSAPGRGAPEWESWTDTGIFDATGALAEIQSVGRIVTDRKLAEFAREEAERLRLAALEAALDCYIGIDDSGAVVEWNVAAERCFGHARAEAIGRQMAELIVPPLMRGAHERGMARHLETGTSHILGRRIEVDAMRADGSVFPIELVIVKGERGGRPIFLAYLRDLTERRAAMTALAEREAQFRTIAESVPVGLVISEIETGAPLYVNPQARKNLGIGPNEPIDSLSYVWEDRTQRQAMIETIEAEGSVSGFEAVLIMRDGRRMVGLISATKITYDGRQALLAVTVDVTEARATAAALRDSEARFKAFMDFAPLAAHLRDAEGRYLIVNREMEKVLGVPAEQALGRFPQDIAPPEIVGNSDANHREVIETGKMQVIEDHLEHLPGDYKWVMAIRFPVRDGEGRVRAAGTVAVDISRLKTAEAALRASEARLAAIIAANPVAMNIARLRDRRLLFVNQPYLRMFGLEGVDLDTYDRNALYADPSERDRIFADIAAGQEVNNFELTLRRADGTPVPASITSRRLVFDGEPALVTSSVDLTDLRAAQAEATRSREALHQSEKMTALGSLLAGVAHELNNPLSVVVGYSSMLLDLVEDEATRNRVERIHDAAERCARIVRTFLAMARARPPRRGAVLLCDVVSDALELAGYGLRSADVEVRNAVSGDLPPVWGDADQLHQVVVNLVVNAHQALLGRPAPRRLTLAARADGATVTLEVADNGPGMAEDIAKRIFEPFFTTKPQGVGTGIGLSVCHGIVTAHGGRIELDTSPDHGARFTVVLPVAVAAVESVTPMVLATPQAAGRVLVVDDEPDIASLLADRLRRDGFAVETATSGSGALDLAARVNFDAAVTDLRMPDMDGTTLADTLATRLPKLRGRILLVTGDALAAEADGRLAAADLPVFEKPLDLDALSRELALRIAAAPESRE